MRLRHSVAFVTGAAGGIGLGIAQALAARGAKVVLADIDAAELARSAAALASETPGSAILAVTMDVDSRADWARAKAEAEARFGPVDILCNNAGIVGDGAPLAEMTREVWDKVIATNLTAVFDGVSTFAPAMIERGRGHIVNTSSLSGMLASANSGAYTASKFAVLGLSESLRLELAPHGVGVSALCPGLVRTRLFETSLARGVQRRPQAPTAPAGLVQREPAEVGEMTARAIEADQFLIVTDMACQPLMEGQRPMVEQGFAFLAAGGW